MAKKFMGWMQGLPLKAKLIASSSLMLMATLVVAGASQRTVRLLRRSVYSLSSASASADWLAQATAYKPELAQYLWTALAGYEEGKGIPESRAKDILSSADNLSEALTKYSVEAPLTSLEQAAFSKLQASWTASQTKVREITQALKAGKNARVDLQTRLTALSDELLNVSDGLSELSGIVKQKGTEASAQASTLEKENKISSAASLAFALGGALFSMFVILGLSRWMTLLTERLASGAHEVDAASKNILLASEQLAQSSSQQAASLQETASAIEEVSAMVNKNAENAQLSRERSKRNAEAANKGQQTVDRMMEAIAEISRKNTDIATQVEAGNREIGEIVRLISEIGDKTKVINDIVFQTKLLSFNASVEAARAGEHGKGFAVVAEEVGNLAQMSGNAAKEISTMLEGSIQRVEAIVSNTRIKVERIVHEGGEKVEIGKSTALECRKVLDGIVADISEVSQMVSEIAVASREQTQGVNEINSSVGQLNQGTQINASTSEKTAQSAKLLAGGAQSLKSIIRDLLMLVHGHRAGLKMAADDTDADSGLSSLRTRPKEETRFLAGRNQRAA